jgi:4-cresol dehydrogenase (hydroxylating)
MDTPLRSEVCLAFQQALGADAVIFDARELRAAETGTFSTTQSVPVILLPKDREGVCAAMRVANQFRMPLYPISSGRNWGYGSRVPVADGCALLDLSRMTRILDFSEELGYVTVEPGVTQQALFDFLQVRKSGLWMDATGSSPQCSLIGNAAERGFGHTPYSDHFAQLCGAEVVLPNGDVVECGFAGLPDAKTGPSYRAGVGPILDGLFSQSNFGVITRATIWLMPAPACFQAFFFQASKNDSLPELVDALRPLRLNGTLRSAVHIGNDYKVLGGIQQFPWGENLPLSRERMVGLRKDLKIAYWSGSGALYGTRPQVKEGRRLLRMALKGKVDRLRFLDDRTIRLAEKFQLPYRLATGLDLRRTLALLKPVYGLLKGIPTRETLGSAYWRKKMNIPADPNPDRDGCGLLWVAPVAPLVGAEARKLVDLAETILLSHGFEPMVSLTLLTERSLAAIISISYDRDILGEDERAMTCYRDLEQRLYRNGFYPYRLSVASMNLQSERHAYSDLLRTIKSALDPNGILAPGRYVPEPN